MANLGAVLGRIGTAIGNCFARVRDARTAAPRRPQPRMAAAGPQAPQPPLPPQTPIRNRVVETRSVPNLCKLPEETRAQVRHLRMAWERKTLAEQHRSSPRPDWMVRLGRAETPQRRHEALTLAVRTELAGLAPGTAEAPNPTAVQRMRDVVHQARAQGLSADDVDALVEGALEVATQSPRFSARRAPPTAQVHGLSVLVQALLRSAPGDRGLVEDIRNALEKQCAARGGSDSWLAGLLRVVDQRVLALDETAGREPPQVDRERLVRHASGGSLPKLGSQLAGLATEQDWSAPRVEEVVRDWMARWQEAGGARGGPRALTPMDLVNTLAALLEHVPPGAGATRVAAVVHGWLANVPDSLRGAACAEVAKRLATADPDPGPEKEWTQDDKLQASFPDERKLVVLSALGWPVELADYPFESGADRLAVQHGLTALPRGEQFKKAVKQLLDAFPPSELPMLPGELQSAARTSREVLATLADACGGRMGEFDATLSRRLRQFVEAHVDVLRYAEVPGGQSFKEFFAREFDRLERPAPLSGGRSPRQVDRTAQGDMIHAGPSARPVQSAPTVARELGALAQDQIAAVQATHPDLADRLSAFWSAELVRLERTALPPPIESKRSAELLDAGYVVAENKHGTARWMSPDEVAARQPPQQRRESRRERKASLSDADVPQPGGSKAVAVLERKDGTTAPRRQPFVINDDVPLPPPPSAEVVAASSVPAPVQRAPDASPPADERPPVPTRVRVESKPVPSATVQAATVQSAAAAEPPPVQSPAAATPARKTIRVPRSSLKVAPAAAQPATAAAERSPHVENKAATGAALPLPPAHSEVVAVASLPAPVQPAPVLAAPVQPSPVQPAPAAVPHLAGTPGRARTERIPNPARKPAPIPPKPATGGAESSQRVESKDDKGPAPAVPLLPSELAAAASLPQPVWPPPAPTAEAEPPAADPVAQGLLGRNPQVPDVEWKRGRPAGAPGGSVA